MTLYVDSSALLKRYVDEHDSEVAAQLTFDHRQAQAARLLGLSVTGT